MNDAMRADAFCPVHGVRWSAYPQHPGNAITMINSALCGYWDGTRKPCMIPVSIQWEPAFDTQQKDATR